MPFYVTCPACGCSLDHGEKCDCAQEAKLETMHSEVSMLAGTCPLDINENREQALTYCY